MLLSNSADYSSGAAMKLLGPIAISKLRNKVWESFWGNILFLFMSKYTIPVCWINVLIICLIVTQLCLWIADGKKKVNTQWMPLWQEHHSSLCLWTLYVESRTHTHTQPSGYDHITHEWLYHGRLPKWIRRHGLQQSCAQSWGLGVGRHRRWHHGHPRGSLALLGPDEAHPAVPGGAEEEKGGGWPPAPAGSDDSNNNNQHQLLTEAEETLPGPRPQDGHRQPHVWTHGVGQEGRWSCWIRWVELTGGGHSWT